MASNFPTSLDSYTALVDNTDTIVASHPNDRGDAIENIEAKVGIDSSAVVTSHDYLLTHLPAQAQNWDIGSYDLRAKAFYADVATGTAPLTITSTTPVDNLGIYFDHATIASEAQGDILYRGASAWARLAAGTSGYFLKTQGAGANPTWSAGFNLKVGTYTGNGAATQAITGVGFQPKALIIMPHASARYGFKTDQMTTTYASVRGAGGEDYEVGHIQLDADGFTVEDGPTNFMNVTGRAYSYVAFG